MTITPTQPTWKDIKKSDTLSQSDDEEWKIFNSHYRDTSIVSGHLNSFADFVNFGMQEIVDNSSTIDVVDTGYRTEFGQITLGEPQVVEDDRRIHKLYPSDARRRNLNYDAPIYINIDEYIPTGDTSDVIHHNRVMIGRMPIMLRSSVCNLYEMNESELIKVGECPNDPGGYFIINGNERILTAQMRVAYNKVFVLKQKRVQNQKYIYSAETRSMSNETGHSVAIKAMIAMNDRDITFSLPCTNTQIPVGIVFKALGYLEDEEIYDLIGIHCHSAKNYLKYIIRDAAMITSQSEALKYIGKRSFHTIQQDKEELYAWQVIETEIFPHLGVTGTIKEQALFLGMIINKLLSTSLGLRPEDDRDNLANKRVDVSGELMYEIFSNLFKKFVDEVTVKLEKRKNIMSALARSVTITKGLAQCLSTGNWTVRKNAKYFRTGVAQVLCRMTRGSTLSHTQRILLQIGKEGKNIKMRLIHPSQFGFVCPSETPEGGKIGAVLNFSLMARSSRRISSVLVREVLDGISLIKPTESVSISDMKNYTRVYLNGVIVGFVEDGYEAVLEIRRHRDLHMIDKEVSVIYDIVDNEVLVHSDVGRFIRPLLTVTDDKLNVNKNKSWNKMIRRGMIRYVDVGEANNSVIAMYPKDLDRWACDYCEIHPSLMFGIMASIIPFPDHSQSPRNCYQCLDPEEPVVMADGTTKKIKNIKIGESVMSVNPITCEQTITTVINQYVRKTEKEIGVLTTDTGRQITCTDDHPVLTTDGWKMAKNADDICVLPQQTVYSHNMKDIVNYNVTNDKHKYVLIKMGLYPLTGDIIPVISRIVGFLLTDGSAGVYQKGVQVQFSFGSPIGCRRFLDDVLSLGFKKNKIVKVCSDMYGAYEQVIYNNAFASMLVGLIDNYTGKRSTQIHPPLPHWIKNGSKLTKREFLSGYQGGDGCSMRYNTLPNRKSGNVILNSTSHVIANEYIDSMTSFLVQLKEMFEEFGVICTGPVIRKSKTDDKKTVHLYFSNSRYNLMVYFENIGWRYDHRKYDTSLPVYEYLRYCSQLTDEIANERVEISKLYVSKSVRQIADAIGKSYSYVNDSIQSIKNNRVPRMKNKSTSFTEWIKSVTVKNHSLFVPVKYTRKCIGGLISDITTESSNHSFIAGDSMCVHNSSMGKQAIGIPVLSYACRTDTLLNVLHHAQRPLVSTRASDVLGFNDMPSGMNVIVAVLCDPYNQEDSIIMNRAAVERGLGTITVFRTYDCIEKKRDTYSRERIGLPPMSTTNVKRDEPGYFRRKNANYSLLDKNGIIKKRITCRRSGCPICSDPNGVEGMCGPSMVVKKGDVIVGKILITSSKTGEEIIKDISRKIETGEEGIIDSVNVTTTPSGYTLVKVKIRQMRQPTLGDKLASREAQKGTIGMIYDPEDMPFNEDGIVPDIIINALCMPSRMTVNQLIEVVMGKLTCETGVYGDSTPFTNESIDIAKTIVTALTNCGMEGHGWETMTCGMTGETIDARVFMGPTYYQRLKHQVADKAHVRARGQVTMLTRQPTEGRSRAGGLRFGEMERDVMIAHGASRALKDRLYDSSDPFKVPFCKNCGIISIDGKVCKQIGCENSEVEMCNYSFSSKLITQELAGMGLLMGAIPEE